jgi:glycosyltransferase involved in cell wall biosynthesis
LKVLHIIAAYKPAVIYGGPTMSVAMLCEELILAGVNVEVFTTTANGTDELPVNINAPVIVDGVPVTYFKRITKDHTHFSPSLLKAVWKRAPEFDAIHIHAWWNLVSVFACMLALRRGIPVILSPRGTLSSYSFINNNSGKKKLIHVFLGKRLLNNCHIHVTSQREADGISNLVLPKSITTIPNFVKLRAYHSEDAPFSYDPFKLLFFSRIEEKKGLDILLGALKQVTVPFHLTIAGDGEKAYINRLKASVTDTKLNAKITWAGFFNDDKFELLRRHHLLVLPSHDENFGNVVIESLSTGTAVLISENVGLAAYVEEHRLGWICKTDAASVSAAIDDIANNGRKKLDNVRLTAQEIVRKDFTGDKLIQQYIGLYHNVKNNERL